jgi:hypothetical protein
MIETDGYFSPGHDRLLSIATWARYFSWIALVVAVLSTIGVFLENFSAYEHSLLAEEYGRTFIQRFSASPAYTFTVLADLLGSLVNGLAYFLVLRAVSFGLNMIVETDINYREQKKGVRFQ